MKGLPLLLAVLIAIGCVAATGCVAPASTPSATPSPSAAPPSVPATLEASASTSISAQPPNAFLSTAGSPPTAGALGTYSWQGTGSDAPWLPGTPTRAAPRSAASISLEPPVAIATWSIRKAKPGATDPTGAREIATGAGPITFAVPADPGTLVLHVEFAASAGDANYFWALSPR